MLTRAFAAIGLAVASVLLGAVPAIAAGPPVDCGSDAQWDGRQCKITATNPGRSGKTPLSGGGGSGESAPRTCAYGSIPMPCRDAEFGWWSDSKSCYVQLTNPQPPATAPAWEGHTDGAIGNAEPLVDSFPYPARQAGVFMMVSNSIGVNFPSLR